MTAISKDRTTESYGQAEIESVVGALEESDQQYLRSHMVEAEGLDKNQRDELLGYLLENRVVDVLSEDAEGSMLYDSNSVDRDRLEELTERELT